ncbi:IclR family transcriptional regulator [Halomicrobium salinisoli]|uniref:IclR family transcriptional regulator n=1 Tax=Halomicrobium salinisoli TaxID=2878391 RepID=UPI001CF0700B|nr:IclR family transcriptional regulator [Halomicrobium salinisoli]
MATDAPRTVEAVQRACRIIETLQERGQTGITELSEEVGFSKSTVHGHLATLVDEGWVVKEEHTYRLSLRFLDIAESLKDRIADHDIVREQVRELAEETGEVVHFGAEEDGRVVYMAKSKGNAAVQTQSRIGKQMPMHSTSLGKAILAELPRERVDEIVERHGMEARTENTLTDVAALHENLAEIERRGYSIDDEENIPGVRCIGIAVTVPEAGVLGALSISGPSQRMTDDRIENELHEKIAQAANVVEVNSMYA